MKQQCFIWFISPSGQLIPSSFDCRFTPVYVCVSYSQSSLWIKPYLHFSLFSRALCIVSACSVDALSFSLSLFPFLLSCPAVKEGTVKNGLSPLDVAAAFVFFFFSFARYERISALQLFPLSLKKSSDRHMNSSEETKRSEPSWLLGHENAVSPAKLSWFCITGEMHLNICFSPEIG